MFSLCSDAHSEGTLLAYSFACQLQTAVLQTLGWVCCCCCFGEDTVVFTAPNAWFHTCGEWVDRYICSTSEVNSRDYTVPPPKIWCELAAEKLQWFGSVGEELSDIPCPCLKQWGLAEPQRCAVMGFWDIWAEVAVKGLLLVGKDTLGQKSIWIYINMQVFYKIKLTFLLSHLFD